jgi:erythronate-4-phosphate dehydrogenase
MKIVCASSVLLGREAFATLGECVVAPDREIKAATVHDADALIVRSKTDCNSALLAGSRVRFVGTATAGFDHFDTDWLTQAGLTWYAAAGCNANSVAEYISAALLLQLGQRRGRKLAGLTLGIVGVGQVGSRVAHKARLLGMRVLLNDPPLAAKTGDPIYRPLEEILPQCDVITLHTPLEKKGPHPTFHLAGEKFFAQLKRGALFINASRGEVMETACVERALAQKTICDALLDVWEDEPNTSRELLAMAALGTPHIAGYSFEGRLNGTVQCHQALCRACGLTPNWTPPRAITHPTLPLIETDAAQLDVESALARILLTAYDLPADDRALRAGASGEGKAWGEHFEKLRKHYPERREFAAHAVRLTNASPLLRELLRGFGFQVEAV